MIINQTDDNNNQDRGGIPLYPHSRKRSNVRMVLLLFTFANLRLHPIVAVLKVQAADLYVLNKMIKRNSKENFLKECY